MLNKTCMMKKCAILSTMLAGGLVNACTTTIPDDGPAFPRASYSEWKAQDDAYRFYPGDTMAVSFSTAPELDRELVVAPDGRVAMPLVGDFMAADLSARELEFLMEQAYSRELVNPDLTVSPTEFGSQQIFVGGDVNAPGVFPLVGQIDPLQAITMAGGWNETAKPQKVIVLRRTSSGKVLRTVVDVKNGVIDPSLYDIGPLKRFDVVFVTRSRIAEENKFIRQYVLDALPIDFSFFYNLRDDAF